MKQTSFNIPSPKKFISLIAGSQPIWKSYLGKRTDDIGYYKLAKKGINADNSSLTSSEKKQIRDLWGSIIPNPLSIGYSFFEMVKGAGEFSAEYVPSAYYMPYIFEVLNPVNLLPTLAHKSLHKFFFRGILQPETVVCSISGILFDKDYNRISEEQAVNIARNCGCDMIFKPATDSSMGRGIKLMKPDSDDLESAISSHFDFILQKKVRQSPFMSELNESSLNCMRITTININGEISATNHIVKIGANGAIVDNIGSGSGGMMVGLSNDGVLSDCGYRVDGTRRQEHNGKSFAGKQIPGFREIVRTFEELHASIPSMGIIGWDVALNEDNQPVLIEANSFWPGITIEQIAGGPAFGSRTREVIDFIAEKNK